MNLADKLSSVRIILIPVFVSLLIYSPRYPYLIYLAAGVFILAVISDFFDGLAARIRKEKSDIGQIIDPLADKLLLLSSFISLYFLREVIPLRYQMPLGIVLVVVSRDVIMALGFIVLNFLKAETSIEPTIAGKLTTFFQMFTILSLLFNMPFFSWVWKAALIFTLISGVDYFLRGMKAINGRDSISNT